LDAEALHCVDHLLIKVLLRGRRSGNRGADRMERPHAVAG
jgi:hypothetical protein